MKKYFEYIMILLIVLSCIALYAYYHSINELRSNKIESVETKKEEKLRDGIRGVVQPSPFIVDERGVFDNILGYANGSIVGQLVYLQRNSLPEAEQKLFVNNKDTTNYILGYLAGQKETPFENGETIELKRKYPYYIQWDRRWAYDALGGTNVAIGGCGPTVVAMALSGMLNDESITPKQIADIEDKNGYFAPGGTKWSFFDFIAGQYGLKAVGVPLSKSAIDNALKSGNPIIVSVHPGKFTTVGHIILITDKDQEGNYIINDPNSYTRTLKKWSYDELKTEIVAMWEFSK